MPLLWLAYRIYASAVIGFPDLCLSCDWLTEFMPLLWLAYRIYASLALYSKLLIHVWISQLAHALLPRTYLLMPMVEYMLLECPIRAPHPQMGHSDWTLLTTSVSPLASSDMCVAIGQVQEYSVWSAYRIYASLVIGLPDLCISCDWLTGFMPLLWLANRIYATPVIGLLVLCLSCDWLTGFMPLLWLAYRIYASPVIGLPDLCLSCDWLTWFMPLLWLV
jgi:hypothetical protein